MSLELERWQPGFAAAEDSQDSSQLATSETDVIDVAWTPVQDPVQDKMTSFEPDLEPTPEPAGGWGGSWLQRQPESETLTSYAEPDVIDTPFTFLQADDSQLPVKRSSGWGGSWFGSQSSELATANTDTGELERYTAALSSDDETPYADWQPTSEREALPADTEAIPAPDFWAQTTAITSQATNMATDTQTTTRNKTRSASRARDKTRPSTKTHAPPSTPTGGNMTTAYDSPSNMSVSERFEGGAKDYRWYFLMENDPRESPDIHALRHWYQLYEEFDVHAPEWNESQFHEWAQSLSASDRQLYVDAGKRLQDGLLDEHLAPGVLKQATYQMRLRGDGKQNAVNNPVDTFITGLLGGLKW